ncbi:MAG: PAS domain-containing protein [Pseudomonadota bacterium]
MIAELQSSIAHSQAGGSVAALAADASPSRADQMKMKVERHALLLRGAPIAISLSAINALIVAMVAWGKVDTIVIAAWTGAAVILSVCRLVLWRHFSAKLKSGHTLIKFTSIHVTAMGLNGMIWGALVPIFAMSGILGNAFLPFIIAGMTAAAISSASASWKAVLAFNLPVLSSAALFYGIFAPEGGLAIATLIVAYAAATSFLAIKTQDAIERSIRLRSRNDNLMGALKRQVRASQEAESRFRALIEATSEFTFIFGPDGRISYASPSIEEALGIPPQTIIGRKTRGIVHPDDLQKLRDLRGEALVKIGAVTSIDKLCLKAGAGDYRNVSGRLTNMLYVPGVEGFVFTGSTLIEEPSCLSSEVPSQATA